jgi:hypothetical protein
LQLYSEIQEELTGQYFEKISISDDPDYYYSGRVTAVSLAENSVSTITVTCSCEPYKTAVLSRTVTVRLAALPLDDSYGDCNGDGVIDTLDATYLIKAVEGESTSELSLSSCDLNLDGTIDNDDITLLNDFLASSYPDIKDYAETLDLYRDTSMTVDFGRCAAVVSFILSYSYIGGNPQPWTMFVDGEQYMQGDCENGSFSGSFIISGKHTLTFRTSRMGKVLLKFPKKRL